MHGIVTRELAIFFLWAYQICLRKVLKPHKYYRYIELYRLEIFDFSQKYIDKNFEIKSLSFDTF